MILWTFILTIILILIYYLIDPNVESLSMKCPLCKKDIIIEPIKTWNYAGYDVSRYICPNCSERFNSYSADGILKFTVPKE